MSSKPLYSTLEVTQKIKLSKSIVSAIRSQDPPGRFLALNKKTGLYHDIGNKKAIEKVSQALREGQQKTKQKWTKIAESNQNNMYYSSQPPMHMVGQNQQMINMPVPNPHPQMMNMAAQNQHQQMMNMPIQNQPHQMMNMTPMQPHPMMNMPMQPQPMQQHPMPPYHQMPPQSMQPQPIQMNVSGQCQPNQMMNNSQNTPTNRVFMNPQMRNIQSFSDSVETKKNSNIKVGNDTNQVQSVQIPQIIEKIDSDDSKPSNTFISSGGAMMTDRDSLSMGTFTVGDQNNSLGNSSLGFGGISPDLDMSQNRKFRLSELTSSITTKLSMNDELLDEELLNYSNDDVDMDGDIELESDEILTDLVESPSSRRRSSASSFKEAFKQFRSSFASFFSRGQSVSSSRVRMSNISNITGATDYSTSKDPYT